MQVTCPQCGARYAVDPLAIGPTGRTVQCVRCSHRWFETIKAAPAASPIPRPAERPVPDFVIRPQSHYSAGLPAISPPRRTAHWGRWIAALVVLVLVVGAAAFAWRDEIRDRLPPGWSALLSLDAMRGAARAARQGDADRCHPTSPASSSTSPTARSSSSTAATSCAANS